ncbi:MAG: hypothetical protein L0Y72_06580 [Gemmataceae bacterium]|nr:hypothetical protein [Gemmataceae bacterium]
MRKTIFVVLSGVLLAGFPWSSSAQKGDSGLNKLMLEKLNSSKMLLEGIALSDFRKIQASAEKLIQVSKTAEWFVFRTPRYELHSNEFRRAAEVIVQKATDKNLDGVALAYFDMTMSCIRCHQYVREVRDARLPSAEPDRFALGDSNNWNSLIGVTYRTASPF